MGLQVTYFYNVYFYAFFNCYFFIIIQISFKLLMQNPLKIRNESDEMSFKNWFTNIFIEPLEKIFSLATALQYINSKLF